MDDKYFIGKLRAIDLNRNQLENKEILSRISTLINQAKDNKVTAWEMFLQGEYAYYSDEYDNSFLYTSRAVNLNPTNYYFQQSLGVDYFQQGDYHKAEQCFYEAILCYPNEEGMNYSAYIDLATVLRYLREYAKSIEKCNEILKTLGDEAINSIYGMRAKESIARTYLAQSEPEKALEYLNEIGAKNSCDPDLLEAYANTYEIKGKYSEASVYYNRAISYAKNDSLLEVLQLKIKNISGIIQGLKAGCSPSDAQLLVSSFQSADKELWPIIQRIFVHNEESGTITNKYHDSYSERDNKAPIYSDNILISLKGWSSSTPFLSEARGWNSLPTFFPKAQNHCKSRADIRKH